MRRAKKPLDKWQCESMDIMLGVDSVLMWTSPEYAEWVARQNGKGALLECRSLTGLFILDEQLIAWSAHEYKTAKEGFLRTKGLIRQLGRPTKNNAIVHVVLEDYEIDTRVQFRDTNGEESIERLDTEARIKWFARSKGSGRGFTAECLLLDEVFALTDEHVDALAPTQLAVENAQTVYTSTPPVKGEEGAPMYRLRDRAEAGDEALGYRDWGAGGWLDEIDGDPRAHPPVPPLNVDDVELWRRTNPAFGTRLTERSIRKLRMAASRQGFARESLCIWPRQVKPAEAGIDAATWGALGDPTSTPGEVLVLSVDVSPGAATAAIATAGRRDDGRMHVKVVAHRPGTSWLVPRLVDLVTSWNPKAVMINSTGPAGAVLADLNAALKLIDEPRLQCEQIRGTGWGQACAAFLADLQEDRMRHCAQESLDDALGCATRKYFGDAAWYWSQKDSNGDISPLCAVTAAAHGFRIFGVEDREILVDFGD